MFGIYSGVAGYGVVWQSVHKASSQEVLGSNADYATCLLCFRSISQSFCVFQFSRLDSGDNDT